MANIRITPRGFRSGRRRRKKNITSAMAQQQAVISASETTLTHSRDGCPKENVRKNSPTEESGIQGPAFSHLQGNVPVLLAGHGIYLRRQQAQGSDNSGASLPGIDHVIQESVLGGNKRIGETLFKLFRLGAAHGVRIGSARELTAVDDVDGSFGSHNGDFGSWPSQVDVRAKVLRAHDAVSAAVGFASDDRDFRHGRFGIGVEEFRAVTDDPSELLRGAGEEAGDVFKRQDRNIERVDEADTAG